MHVSSWCRYAFQSSPSFLKSAFINSGLADLPVLYPSPGNARLRVTLRTIPCIVRGHPVLISAFLASKVDDLRTLWPLFLTSNAFAAKRAVSVHQHRQSEPTLVRKAVSWPRLLLVTSFSLPVSTHRPIASSSSSLVCTCSTHKRTCFTPMFQHRRDSMLFVQWFWFLVMALLASLLLRVRVGLKQVEHV